VPRAARPWRAGNAGYQAQWQVYTTAKGAAERFVPQALGTAHAAMPAAGNRNRGVRGYPPRFQEVFGFGGAITDAAAETCTPG
jgi:glucosylceramidase